VGILQLEMYEEATAEEIKAAKSLLTRYRRIRSLVLDFEREGIEELAPKQIRAYTAYQKTSRNIERAVKLILDEEVRRIIEMRYIKGERHKVTVLYFSNMHAATVARKLNEGIEAVANTLKLIE